MAEPRNSGREDEGAGRRRAVGVPGYKICKAEWFPVSNKLLRTELGISRKVKYTTLRWLERAGAIALRSRGRGNKRALEVKMLW
jgi:hypothetical protein